MAHSYWHCPHSMRTRVYATVERPPVCPSACLYICGIIRPQQRRAAGLLLSSMRAEDIDRQRRAPGAQQQMRAVPY